MNNDKAIMIARNYYEQKGLKMTKVYDAGDIIIAYGRKDGKIRFGGGAITVNKQTGDIGKFILPSDKNFAILEQSTLIIYEE